MVDFVGLGVLLLLTLLFGFLLKRAWGSRNAILKWVGLVLMGLLTLLFAVVFVTALVGTIRLNGNFNASHPVSNITVAGTPEQVARGEQLVTTCTGCHGTDGGFPLKGNNFEGMGPPLGTLWSANLTPAGNVKDWSDGEIVRAIREGVHKSGRSLIFMPSGTYRNFADEDAQAIVAALRKQAPVGQPPPATNLNVLGAVFNQLIPFVMAVQPPITQAQPRPPIGANVEYGKYLVNAVGCADCHGANFGGGTPATAGLGPPVGPPLRDIGKRYTEEQFVNVFRKGVNAGGTELSPMMPWKEYGGFGDDEFKAVYLYLSSLTGK